MPNQELDLNSLLEEFNMPMTKPEIESPRQLQQVSEEEIKQEIENQGTVEDISRKNIAGLTRVFQYAENEFAQGNVNAKLLEATAKIADAISNAARIIADNEMSTLTIQQRDKQITLKELEVQEKIRLTQEKLKSSNQQVVQGTQINVFSSDRESVLDIIKKGMTQNEIITADFKTIEDNPTEFEATDK